MTEEELQKNMVECVTLYPVEEREDGSIIMRGQKNVGMMVELAESYANARVMEVLDEIESVKIVWPRDKTYAAAHIESIDKKIVELREKYGMDN